MDDDADIGNTSNDSSFEALLHGEIMLVMIVEERMMMMIVVDEFNGKEGEEGKGGRKEDETSDTHLVTTNSLYNDDTMINNQYE